MHRTRTYFLNTSTESKQFLSRICAAFENKREGAIRGDIFQILLIRMYMAIFFRLTYSFFDNRFFLYELVMPCFDLIYSTLFYYVSSKNTKTSNCLRIQSKQIKHHRTSSHMTTLPSVILNIKECISITDHAFRHCIRPLNSVRTYQCVNEVLMYCMTLLYLNQFVRSI